MSTKALAMFQANAIPAHIASFVETESNIAERQTTPSLSYGGKNWTVSLNGEATKMMKKDADGDEVPLSVMRVVILGYAPRRGRAYYPGAYDKDKPGTPECWSDDGEKPNASITDVSFDGWTGKCKDCPMAAKGSRITDSGAKSTACTQHRMLAVVPANDLNFTPLRLKLAITSDYDGKSPDLEAAGWFAFSNYTDMLRKQGIMHTGALVTKMKFDPDTDYPKVIFSPDKWLSAEQIAVIGPISKSDAVKSLLSGTWTPAGADGKQIEGEVAETPVATTKPVKPKALPTKTEEEVAAEAKAARKAAKLKAAQEAADAAAKAAAAAADDDDDEQPVLPSTKAAAADDDDDDDVVLPAPAKAAAKPKAAPAKAAAKPKEAAAPVSTADINASTAAVLADWEDEE